MDLSIAEENYLKTIFSISQHEQGANTNAIAKKLDTKASSVTDMLKKLHDKKLVHYQRYKPVRLSQLGQEKAISLIRSHRLWETFLVRNLGYNWSEVHVIAERLEHIQDAELVDRLDSYLNHPSFDPHGDPIPNKSGEFPDRKEVTLLDLGIGNTGTLASVLEDDQSFLEILNRLGIKIGTRIFVERINTFDGSYCVILDDNNRETLSNKICTFLSVIPYENE